jgi:hypothetical protein
LSPLFRSKFISLKRILTPKDFEMFSANKKFI